MVSALVLLTFSIFASEEHGKAYPSCDHHTEVAHVTPASGEKDCSPHVSHQEHLHAVVDKTKETSEFEEAGQKVKLSAIAQIQHSIDAREKLISCLSGPAEESCAKSLQLAKDRIHRSLRMLRVVNSLTIFNNPDYAAPTPEGGRLPMYLGGGKLGPLNERERERARSLRRKALMAAERYGKVDVKGTSYTLVQLQEMCAKGSGDLPDACDWAAIQKTALRRAFQKEMQNLADRLVADMPIVAQFNEIPISDQALRKALEDSRTSLKKWQKEFYRKNNADPDMLLAYPEVVDGVLADNPGLCGTVSKKMGEFEHAKHSNETKMALTKLGLGVTTCLLTSGAGCLAFGSAVAGSYILNDYDRMAFEKRNLLASDPGGNLANVNRARAAQHDFMIQAALAGSLAAFPIMKTALRTASEVAITESTAGSALAREAAHETVTQGKETAMHHFGTEGAKSVVNRGDQKDGDTFRTFVMAELEEDP